MNVQSRYVCHECHRQWVHAHGWQLGDNCPACGSQSPTLETYTPAFPGADFERVASIPPVLAPPIEAVSEPSPAAFLTGAQL